MEYIYKGPNKTREAVNIIGGAVLAFYASLGIHPIFGDIYKVATKTGHPSADIATGRSQPTQLEQILINSVK